MLTRLRLLLRPWEPSPTLPGLPPPPPHEHFTALEWANLLRQRVVHLHRLVSRVEHNAAAAYPGHLHYALNTLDAAEAHCRKLLAHCETLRRALREEQARSPEEASYDPVAVEAQMRAEMLQGSAHGG